MYSTLTQGFADRASTLIESGSRAALIYAALEIRMGVEARLQSYVQANDEVSERLKRGWKIPMLFKGLEKTFSNSSQVVEFQIAASGSDPVVMCFIPVSANLRTHAERLGNVLHYTADSHMTDKWWSDLQDSLTDALCDLKICAKASLLGVPLLDPRSGQVLTKFEFHSSDPRGDLMRRLAETKEQHRFNVAYIPTEQYYASAR